MDQLCHLTRAAEVCADMIPGFLMNFGKSARASHTELARISSRCWPIRWATFTWAASVAVCTLMRLEASHVGGRLGRRGIRHKNNTALRMFERF